MDDLRLHAVVALVVAWHNRHPLARRITAAQVNSVGYVSVPCTAPGLPPRWAPVPPAPPPAPVPAPVPGEPIAIDPVIETDDPGAIVIDVDPESQSSADADGATATATAAAAQPPPAAAAHTAPAGSSLRARASAGQGAAEGPSGAAPSPVPQAALPSPGAPRTLVCSEDFLAPVPISQVLDWVRRHGLDLSGEPGDGPVRQVPVDAALLPAGSGVGRLWVATAAIEIGGQRHRLLLGGGDQPAVLGRRVPSLPRLLGAAAAPCLLLVAAVWWMWPAAAGPTKAVTAMPAVTGTAASAALAVASPPVAASAAEAGASAVAVAIAIASGPNGASADPPRLPGLLDDDAKARARAAVAALRAERQAIAPAPAPSAAAAAAMPPPAASAAKPAPPPAVLFGLSTRPLRTRAEAEQLQAAFQALLGGTPGSLLRVEMLPAGEDWRVVCWPYEHRAAAEKARALLQARGLSVELVDF